VKKYCWIGLIVLSVFSMTAHAFSSVDEQIDHYLEILDGDNNADKITMLQRLQWSGLSDPRLYTEIESRVIFRGFSKPVSKEATGLLAHQIRALGYSGNEQYRSTLENIRDESKNSKLKRHAEKALSQLDDFKRWNQLIQQSDIDTEGKSAEVANYMKMLTVDDVSVQRMAARAIYWEKQQDSDLQALTAEKLKSVYLEAGLDGQAQDTAAWFCKALGQSGNPEYLELLKEVNKNTPHRKIKKHSLKVINCYGCAA
jgi:hypothetical protein